MSASSAGARAVFSAAGAQLRRSTTAQRLAEVLRDQILDGELPPGTPFREHELTATFEVSRNTVREGFQILVGERLLVHQPHRGVFVRRLAAADVRDIYAFRRLVECAALRHPDPAGVPSGLADMRAAVAEGVACAQVGDWQRVGTADVRFHIAVAALAGSERLTQAVRALLAELRLAFQLVPDAAALHGPYLEPNQEILALAESGSWAPASRAMDSYLERAEASVLAAMDGG